MHPIHGNYGFRLSHSMKPLSLQQVISILLDKPVVLRRALPTSQWEFSRTASAPAFRLADLLLLRENCVKSLAEFGLNQWSSQWRITVQLCKESRDRFHFECIVCQKCCKESS